MSKLKIIVSAIIVAFVAIIILGIKMNSTIGVMTKSINTEASNRTEITFNAKKDEYIIIQSNCKVKHGTIVLQLNDSANKAVEKFKGTNNDIKEIKLNNSGEYTFSIEYNNFIGDYYVKLKHKKLLYFTR